MNSPLPLYAPLPTPEETRLWDSTAVTNFSIPAVLLMENAGREALAELNQHVPLLPGTRVLVVMGRGNNGGDGAAIARGLHDKGCTVLVYHLGRLRDAKSPTKEHVRMAKSVGVFFMPMKQKNADVLPPEWRNPDIVIDAITGTGIRGDLREPELAAVRMINSFAASALRGVAIKMPSPIATQPFIFSLDIPSGLCGYTGKPRPEAVQANVTITFEAGKPGLFFPEARPYTGKVVVRSIGMPASIRALAPSSWRLLAPVSGAWARPSAFLHKGTAGRVLVIGGSAAMAGAPVLCAIGALRAGSGVVHVACPSDIVPQMRQGWPEILVHGVGSGAEWTPESVSAIPALIQSTAPKAIMLGPGIGRSLAAMDLVRTVLEHKERPPVVVDADALHFFHLPMPVAAKKDTRLQLPLSLLRACDIVTPHPGEMAKMLPCSFFPGLEAAHAAAVEDKESKKQSAATLRACIEVLQEDRGGAVRAFTRICSAVLVLKGAGTLVGQHDMPLTLSPFATSTLAVPGSGDVLAGAVAALVGMGITPFDAASLGVYLHARAGQMLERKSLRGHFAQEIADTLPLVWQELTI